jgi:glycosyltransferase involved in cell wall biosynthesis
MRIAIVTDAWQPQVNGVVRTLGTTGKCLADAGHTVQFMTPDLFRTVPCPTYPEIRLAVLPQRKLASLIDAFAPDAVHIATEGPLGHAAQRLVRQRRWPFTTAFHTQFPEYLRLRAPLPVSWSYAYLRRFHGFAAATMVPTRSQLSKLAARGFANLKLWQRGVDTEIFRPDEPLELPYARPLHAYMGRVAVEKNIEAFLDLKLSGTKIVIGDGPDLERLRARYPDTVFVGAKFGRELARHLSAADVFVFPSRTDTFGLVMLEAMACGVPVAAFPVQGPLDVVDHRRTGVLDDDLALAIQGALKLNRADCVAAARACTWARCTAEFVSHLVPIPGPLEHERACRI